MSNAARALARSPWKQETCLRHPRNGRRPAASWQPTMMRSARCVLPAANANGANVNGAPAAFLLTGPAGGCFRGFRGCRARLAVVYACLFVCLFVYAVPLAIWCHVIQTPPPPPPPPRPLPAPPHQSAHVTRRCRAAQEWEGRREDGGCWRVGLCCAL